MTRILAVVFAITTAFAATGYAQPAVPGAVAAEISRLQEAADRSRTDPAADLAAIAAELGYTDHAHLTNDFQKTLGFAPSTYRRSVLEDQAGDQDGG